VLLLLSISITPLEEQTRAARTLLSLHQSVWPAIGVVIVIMSVLSIFITHKIAGPVYRLKKVLAEVAAGKLGVTITLRKNDDLQDLAAGLNVVVGDLREFVTTLKADHEVLSRCLGELEEQAALADQGEAGRELLARLQASRQSMARTLDKYSVS
jgi:methyl-accepting chemotaxis protein